ncbi:oligosaccharide flippase family protein [Streptomyces sp. PKU-MA01144]|uniref:oligosaccharide flippase family protein n=1 Tax=Streptomyces sp. PKU-MA01144 TaxID=2729138 RepID=UPI00147AC165|nr:oligosaccharide flippase family protein [Streptomyces sp. PKU-MA01144]NNJ07243.1 oligosaccharide flippase family protein [Streptomyces sp. PKU-MA01144]
MKHADADCVPAVGARSALRWLRWNCSGSAVLLVLQLAYTMYTGRTVTPSAFGAYAIALTVIQLLGYVSNGGLATYVLRAGVLTRPAVHAAWRLGTACGILCFLVVQTTAPLIGTLWHMPEMTPLLRLLGCQFLVQPAATVVIATLRRTGRARTAVICELAGQASGIAAGVTLIALGWNPLGLAAAQPAAAAVTLALVTLRVSARPVLPPGAPVRARQLLVPSGFLAGFGLLEFASTSSPTWMAGHLFGAGATGAYSRAAYFVGLPSQVLFQGLNSAATPLLAERRASDRLVGGRAAEYVVCAASAATFVGFGALCGLGPAALGLLLGPGWELATALVPLTAAGAGMALLCRSGMIIDQTRHASRAVLTTQLTVLSTTFAGIGIAVMEQSLVLLAGAVAVGQTAGHLVQLGGWHRAGLLHTGAALRMHAIHALIGGGLGAAAALGGSGRPPAAAIGYGLACMLPVVVLCALFRRWIPLYAVASAAGILRSPGGPRAGPELTGEGARLAAAAHDDVKDISRA